MPTAFGQSTKDLKQVVIVDDSQSMRAIVRAMLEGDGRFDVVGEAGHAHEARAVIKATNPDVITLDIEMPQMDGLSFLEKIMRLRPMPVVMLSSLTDAGTAEAVRALSIGAVDCVSKSGNGDNRLSTLPDRVFAAAGATVTARQPVAHKPIDNFPWNGKTLLIGSSTGGVEALERVLVHFPADCPPCVIVQHMPEKFLANFATRLNAMMAPDVATAQDGQRLERGQVRIAPGGAYHVEVEKNLGGLCTRLVEKGLVSGHRPSVDVLFNSATPVARDVVAALLTGMGRDGASGMLALKQAGATTLAQDKATCVVFGMPRAAAEIEATDRLLPLDAIGPALLAHCSKAQADAVR